MKLRGLRIELGEIEAALGEHVDVQAAVVIARKDEPRRQRLVAYILPANQSVSVEELRRALEERLPDYMVPSAFVLLEEWPRLPNGKIDRASLPAPDHVVRSPRVYVAPRNAIEETLAEIWQQVLGVKQVGIHDGFFELGGDSILSIQIVARANQAGLKLAPKLIFRHQTIAELSPLHRSRGCVNGVTRTCHRPDSTDSDSTLLLRAANGRAASLQPVGAVGSETTAQS